MSLRQISLVAFILLGCILMSFKANEMAGGPEVALDLTNFDASDTITATMDEPNYVGVGTLAFQIEFDELSGNADMTCTVQASNWANPSSTQWSDVFSKQFTADGDTLGVVTNFAYRKVRCQCISTSATQTGTVEAKLNIVK